MEDGEDEDDEDEDEDEQEDDEEEEEEEEELGGAAGLDQVSDGSRVEVQSRRRKQ